MNELQIGGEYGEFSVATRPTVVHVATQLELLHGYAKSGNGLHSRSRLNVRLFAIGFLTLFGEFLSSFFCVKENVVGISEALC